MNYQKLNINQMCRVKLTNYGRHIVDHKRSIMASWCPKMDWSSWRKVDDKGYLTLELWAIMHMFGEYMQMGGDSPFDTVIEIQIEETPTKKG